MLSRQRIAGCSLKSVFRIRSTHPFALQDPWWQREIRKLGRFGPKLYGGTLIFTCDFRILPGELFCFNVNHPILASGCFENNTGRRYFASRWAW